MNPISNQTEYFPDFKVFINTFPNNSLFHMFNVAQTLFVSEHIFSGKEYSNIRNEFNLWRLSRLQSYFSWWYF